MNRAVDIALRWIPGWLLLLAGAGKWMQGWRAGPVESIYDQWVAGQPWRHAAFIGVEVILGLWILLSRRPRPAFAALLLFWLLLTGVLAGAWWRNAGLDCGCIPLLPDGPAPDPRRALTVGIIRNLLLALMALLGWARGRRRTQYT